MMAGLIGIFWASICSADRLDDVFRPRRVALVIGINNYTSAGLSDLKFATNDGIAMAEMLRSPLFGDFDHVEALTDSVTEQEIRDAFGALTADLHADDVLVVYIASHGTARSARGEDRLYILASDSELDGETRTGIPIVEFHDSIKELPVRRTALIIDACYNNAGRSRLSQSMQEALQERRSGAVSPSHRDPDRYEGRYYAARLHQAAIEDRDFQGGVYTHFFLEAITVPPPTGGPSTMIAVGDAIPDGVVDLWEAHRYATEKTHRFTAGQQSPWYEHLVEGEGRIALRGSNTERLPVEHGYLNTTLDDGFGHRVLYRGVALDEGVQEVQSGLSKIEVYIEEELVYRQRVYIRTGELSTVRALLQRDRRPMVGTGVSVSPGLDYLPALWWDVYLEQSRRALAGRVGTGLEVRTGIGAPEGQADDFSSVAAGTALARADWTTAGPWLAGGRIAGGLVWRNPETTALQGGPILTGGVLLGRDLKRGRIIAEPGALLTVNEDGLTTSFQTAVQFGFQL